MRVHTGILMQITNEKVKKSLPFYAVEMILFCRAEIRLKLKTIVIFDRTNNFYNTIRNENTYQKGKCTEACKSIQKSTK